MKRNNKEKYGEQNDDKQMNIFKKLNTAEEQDEEVDVSKCKLKTDEM